MTILRLFSLAVFFSLTASVALADPVEDAVSDIRAKYNQIEGGKLDKQVIEFAPEDDPSYGKVTKYFQNGQLVKANYVFGAGDHGGADETYYYHNGQLFFIYVAQSSWRFTGNTLSNGESETIDSMVEHRLYFQNGNLIRHLRKEVESTNYDALGSLIAKAKNQPHQDPSMASAAKMRGFQIPGVGSWQDIATMLQY
ncbi:MAG: hypothetical protein AAGF67_12570 [Verrucomicrobiota bacterium]